MKLIAHLPIAFLLGLPSVCNAALVAYWNFNTLTTNTNNGTSYSPTSGSGSIAVSVAASANSGSYLGINSFAGSTTNAIGADVAGQALTIEGGASESTTPVQNNGATIVIQVNLTGLADPVMTFTSYRNFLGFRSNQVAYSIDGTSYTDFETPFTPNPPNFSSIYTFNFSSISDLDGAATAYFRITFGGARSTTGYTSIDNIQINAVTVVPEPGFALLGSLGILGIFRRRR